MRLIDADALNDAMFRKSFETDDGRQQWDGGLWIRYKVFEEALDEAPTIDAAPVVLCKDCKFHGVEESMGEPKLYLHYCEDTNRIVKPTCFCSFAERKVDETI